LSSIYGEEQAGKKKKPKEEATMIGGSTFRLRHEKAGR
jgi:hypothetical protein